MTRAARDRNALLPVSRNIVAPHTNTDTRIPLTSLTTVTCTGPGPRKGKAKQKIGMWGTLSTDYRTPSNSTHDTRYDQTISNRAV